MEHSREFPEKKKKKNWAGTTMLIRVFVLSKWLKGMKASFEEACAQLYVLKHFWRHHKNVINLTA